MLKRKPHLRSATELQNSLGARLRTLRLARNLDQKLVAEKGGISLSALRNLESGRGATVETLVRFLRALDYTEGLDAIAPEATINPVNLLRSARPQQRVRRPRKATS